MIGVLTDGTWCSKPSSGRDLMTALILAGLVCVGGGRTDEAGRPAGTRIAIYSEFSGVVVPVGESVRMDLTVENKGRQDEVVALKLTSVPRAGRPPEGGSFTVTGVAVPDGKTRTLSFSAERTKGGLGRISLDRGVTADTKLTANYSITVVARERSRLE